MRVETERPVEGNWRSLREQWGTSGVVVEKER